MNEKHDQEQGEDITRMLAAKSRRIHLQVPSDTHTIAANGEVSTRPMSISTIGICERRRASLSTLGI